MRNVEEHKSFLPAIRIAFLVCCASFAGALPVFAADEAAIELAVTNGLAWLATQQNGDGSWGLGCNLVGETGLVVLKFETRAIELGFDPLDPAYQYAGQVTNGLAFIQLNQYTQGVAPGDPDGNGNGLAVYFSDCGDLEIYQTGIAMMALADLL